jgi:Prion-inhibition and propagation
MALNILDVTFSSLGLASLVTTVKDCVAGYDHFIASVDEIPDKSQKLALQIKIEQRKFQLFWEYLGLSDHGCPLLEDQNYQTRQLVVEIAATVKSILSDITVLADKYGVDDTSVWKQDVEWQSTSQSSPSMPAYMLNLFGKGARQDSDPVPRLTRMQSFKWKWKDEQKAMNLLADLKDFNQQLWMSLPQQHGALLKQGEPSWILPGLDEIWAIHEVANAAEAHHPLLICSNLRTATLDTNSMPAVSFTGYKPLGLEIREDHDIGPGRRLGKLNRTDVIVEYKSLDDSMSPSDRDIVKSRIESLVKLLARKNHPMLRILRGISFFQEEGEEDRFGFIFECPSVTSFGSTSFATLEFLLQSRSKDSVESLGKRFKLAQALSKSVMLLHAAGWYHKNLRPDGIIFQRIDSGGFDITEPRIMGFEYSRPNEVDVPSLDFRNSSDLDLYSHPERQLEDPPKFVAKHDYFSLGMCLLAIGWWRPISELEKKFKKQFGANSKSRLWQTFAQTEASRDLKALCGELYAEAVCVCLSGQFSSTTWSSSDGKDEACQRAFFNQVVKKLHMCRA